MKIVLLILVLLLSGASRGQDTQAPVIRLFSDSMAMSENVGPVAEVMWSPDGKYIVTGSKSPSQDGLINSWSILDSATGEWIRDAYEDVVWYADGKRALLGSDGTNLWSLDLGTRETFSLPLGTGDVVGFARDGLIYDEILIWEDETLRIYHASDGKLKSTRQNIQAWPRYSTDRQLAAVQTSDKLEIYNTATWTLIDSLPNFALIDETWSADNRHLVVVPIPFELDVSPMYIWTIGEGLSVPLYGIDNRVWWSPDGTQMADAEASDLRFFDSTTGEMISYVRGVPFVQGPLSSSMIAIANDRYLVRVYGDFGGSGPIYIAVINVNTHDIVLEEPLRWIGGLGLYDDTLIVKVSGSHTVLYDLTGRAVPIVLRDHPYSTLSPDSRWILSMDEPQQGLLYRLSTGERLTFDLKDTLSADAHLSFDSDDPEAVMLSWSPDSRRFALFGSDANTLSVWELTD